jgi:hypothetical protein
VGPDRTFDVTSTSLWDRIGHDALRRKLLAGVAASVVAARLPPGALVATYVDSQGYEWAGGFEWVDIFIAIDAAEVETDRPYL